MKLSELSATPSGSIAAPAPPSGGATTARIAGEAGGAAGAEADLTREELLAAYRLMLLSRRLDDKEIQLKNQSQIFFQVSGAGHEAILVAAGRQLRRGEDWAFPYYRDRAFCLALGVTPYEMLLQGVGSKDDPASGGRQMPSHWGSRRLNIVSGSSPTGTQCLHGVGCAEATMRYERLTGVPQRATQLHDGEITYVSTGEGATSQGEFWETLNTASQEKLPLVILVEDNGYAISVPVAEQTPGGDVSRLLHGFPDLLIEKVDGCDYVASYAAMRRAIAYTRARRGPALVHARVIRPYSHSLSDDEKLYKTPDERAREAERDPIPQLARRLQQAGYATADTLAAIASDVDREIAEATDLALVAAKPDPQSATLYVYSPNVDPAGAAFDAEPSTEGRPDTMVAAINQTLKDEMARTPHMLVFGEDVADCPPEALPHVSGKGGVFKVTHGLQRAFGRDRVFNSPLAEANIVGRALGLSVRGFKPVVEIQFFDYIWPAMIQIRDEVTMLRYRSNNTFACPMVIRVPIGGYLRGGAPYHSQSGESIFAHCPGLRIAYPSNAVDAAGLLRTSIRCEDPVLFLEHKHLYRQTYNKGVYPGPDYTLPFGKAAVRRPGTDLTVITWGALVQRTLLAAQQAEKDDISVRVIDLRSLMPFDWDTIALAVRETNRVIVAHEDQLTCGFGAEIAARIGEQCFGDLDAPVTRVAALDTPVAYEPGLEEVILPQTSHVLAAIKALAQVLTVILRVIAVALGLALPLAVQPAAPRVDDDAARRLFARADVVAAVDALKAREPAIIDDQVALSEIPAPPFKEATRAEALRQRFVAAGLSDVRLDAVGNVLGVRRGKAARPHVVISAHIDTVFPEGTDVRVTRTGTVLKGPGIGDDARGLAVMVAIANALARSSIQTAGTVTFVGTVGEEGLGDIRGARHLVNTELAGTIDAFVSLDGVGLEVTNVGVGSRRYKVTFSGPGGHSYGAFGTANPIHALGRAVAAVGDLAVPSSPRTTFNVGRIGGGTSVNAIPFEAWFEIDLRSADSAALASLDARFRSIVDHAVAAENARWGKPGQVGATLTVVGDRPAGNTAETAAIVRAARSATTAIGERLTLREGSTDANAAMYRGIPALTIDAGGTGSGAHALDERFDSTDSWKGTIRAFLLTLLLAGA